MRYRIFVHNHFWLECHYITEVTQEIANLVYGGIETSAITVSARNRMFHVKHSNEWRE